MCLVVVCTARSLPAVRAYESAVCDREVLAHLLQGRRGERAVLLKEGIGGKMQNQRLFFTTEKTSQSHLGALQPPRLLLLFELLLPVLPLKVLQRAGAEGGGGHEAGEVGPARVRERRAVGAAAPPDRPPGGSAGPVPAAGGGAAPAAPGGGWSACSGGLPWGN